MTDKLAAGFRGSSWVNHPRELYSVSSAYKWLRGESPSVEWKRWIWNRLNLLKIASFAGRLC